MLRETFDDEGLQANLEAQKDKKLNINLARWGLSDAIEKILDNFN